MHSFPSPRNLSACSTGARGASFALSLLVLAATLGAPAAWAGRPLDTEDTGVLAPNTGELELSVNHARRGDEGAWALHAVISVGLLPRLEARIESELAALVGSRAQDDAAGAGDSLVGVKYRLLDEGTLEPSVLGSLALRLPTGDDKQGLGAPGVDVSVLVAIGKIVGPVALTWNAGYTFVTADRASAAWRVSMSAEYRAANAWLLVGEVVSFLRAGGATRDQAVVRAGAVYAVTDRLRVDGAVGAGVTRAAPDVTITIGLTLRLF